LRTLARIGPKAIPFLVVRTNDADPKVRSYATRLLGELPSLESALAIARRFYDGDVEVRRGALAAARLLSNAPDALEALVAELGGMAEDRGKPTGVRLMAMETLAELRQAQAVSHLVRVLTDNPVDVVQAARRALVILARHDVGASPAAWAEWWRQNASRHRIEWLIDALTDDSAEIRRAAGEELKAQTREYFGYYDDLPPAERAHAQRKYREWWEARGKGRFRSQRH
jgi:HEAT repeat protein